MNAHTELTVILLTQAARDPSKAEYVEQRLATLIPEEVAEGRKLFAEQPKPELVIATPKAVVSAVAADPEIVKAAHVAVDEVHKSTPTPKKGRR